MGQYAKIAVDAGLKIIGGCCGYSPEVIKAIAEAIKDYKPQPINKQRIITTLGEPVNKMPKAQPNSNRRTRRR